MTSPRAFSHCLTFCSTIDDSASWIRSDLHYKKKSQFFLRNVIFANMSVCTYTLISICHIKINNFSPLI